MLVHYEIIVMTSPSITGVTYMDHFDFEERYRDANECNPFYWHPLHLPAYCAHIFEKLIRARIATKTPVRITREREKIEVLQDTDYSGEYHYHDHGRHNHQNRHFHYPHGSHHPQFNYPEEIYQFPYPLYQITSAESESYSPPYTKIVPLSPYEEMLELLKEDIKKGPSSPTVTVMPELGPVALYNQAISKKSVNLIRAMAEAFVKASKKAYEEYYAAYQPYPSEPQVFVYDSAKNKTDLQEHKKKPKPDKKDKNKVHRIKTKHGGVVTIIETKNLEMMKKDGPLL
uniref:Uncharacterized protein n=1 Tax=Heliothis virescens TaxID=7102 RepID=A0A2A4J0Z7_HELVI